MGLKRRAEKSREKRIPRKVNPTILIICEGKETEVSYFKNFNSRYTRVDVIIPDKKSSGKNKGKETDPENLVKRSIEYKETKYDIDEKDGDRVWCLFDIDIDFNNPNALNSKITQIQKSQTIANRNKIKLGISNPCFELWYLLHFEYTTGALKNYNAVQQKLSKYLPSYEKNKNVYAELKNLVNNAETNAIKLREYHKKNGKNLFNCEHEASYINPKDIVKSNPYTNICDLVQYMEALNNKK